MSSLKLYFDGCSKNNSKNGLAGCGWVIYIDDTVIIKGSKSIGTGTNNEAEYQSLIFGLEDVLALEDRMNLDIFGLNLEIYGDSLLVINQLKGLYQVKAPNLFIKYNKVVELLSKISSKFNMKIESKHVLRHLNSVADELANKSLEKLCFN